MIDVRIKLDLSVAEASALELALHERQKKIAQRKAERFYCDLNISYEEQTIRTLEDIKTKIMDGVYDAGEGRRICPGCGDYYQEEQMIGGYCVLCAGDRP